MADNVETLGVDLRTGVKSLGAKEKGRRKKCRMRFSLIKRNKAFQKKASQGGGQEVVTSGHGASKDVESSCSGDSSHSKILIEEADGSSSGQKECDIPVLVRGSFWP